MNRNQRVDGSRWGRLPSSCPSGACTTSLELDRNVGSCCSFPSAWITPAISGYSTFDSARHTFLAHPQWSGVCTDDWAPVAHCAGAPAPWECPGLRIIDPFIFYSNIYWRCRIWVIAIIRRDLWQATKFWKVLSESNLVFTSSINKIVAWE